MSILRRKKVLTALLCTLALALAGCGGDNDPETTAQPSEEPTAEEPRELKTVRYLIGQPGAITPMVSGLTSAVELGYFADEGLDMEFIAAEGTATTIQSIATGAAEYGSLIASQLVNATAEAGDLGVVDACNWTSGNHWQLWVKPDSPIQSIDEFKGLSIGVRATNDSEYLGIRTSLAKRGIDPDRDVDILAVTGGATAGEALKTGEVDVLAIWDGAIAPIRDLGYEMRQLPEPPEWEQLFGAGLGVGRDYLEENAEEVAGVCRAIIKGQIFALVNPEAAVRLHWVVSPESRPEGPEDEAVAASMLPLQARIVSFTPCGEVECPGWEYGSHDPERWQATVDFLGVDVDPSTLYTNDLVDLINPIDVDAVVSEAEGYVVE